MSRDEYLDAVDKRLAEIRAAQRWANGLLDEIERGLRARGFDDLFIGRHIRTRAERLGVYR